MAFSKYAYADVVQASMSLYTWDAVRQKALAIGPGFGSRTASKVVLEEYDPKKFLLTHCTIVSSVDTEEPKDVKLGKQRFEGQIIDRRYPDYYITPETTEQINSNLDCWERKLLLASYRTFIGGQNYQEHIQIPELSKGKIIDAAARDLGSSVYIDILIATDRKHGPLVEDIQSGKMCTLSMGSTVAHTTCSRCGNVASDEPNLCNCIKYQKGNYFLDPMGIKRRCAEICGNFRDPTSNRFLEASWVKNPAFTGAVVRNIFDPTTAELVDKTASLIQRAFISSEPGGVDLNALKKAASSKTSTYKVSQVVQADINHPSIGTLIPAPAFASRTLSELNKTLRLRKIAQGQQQEAFDFDDGSQQQEKKPKEEAEPKDPLEKVKKDLEDSLVEDVADKVRKDMNKGEESKTIDWNHSNESLIKSASKDPEWKRVASVVAQTHPSNSPRARSVLAGLILYQSGGWSRVIAAKRFSGEELIDISSQIDRVAKKSSLAGATRIDQIAVQVGGTSKYANETSYLSACSNALGRALTGPEEIQLVFKGKLFSMGHN